MKVPEIYSTVVNDLCMNEVLQIHLVILTDLTNVILWSRAFHVAMACTTSTDYRDLPGESVYFSVMGKEIKLLQETKLSLMVSNVLQNCVSVRACSFALLPLVNTPHK